MNDSGMILALIAVAISLISIGLLFFVYVNLSSELGSLKESVSDSQKETKSELEKINASLEESKSREMLIQEELSLLRQANDALIANHTLLEQRISFMQAYIMSLEGRVRALEAGAPPTYFGTFTPVAHWSFDDNRDIGHDSSDNGNDMGLNNGLAPVQDNSNCRVGGCLSFDGADDYAVVPKSDSIEPSRAITISAWIYARDPSSSSFINKAYTSHEYPFYSYDLQITQAPDQPTIAQAWFDLTTDGGYQYIGGQSTGAVIDLHTWQFITATYDGSNMKLYINGEVKASAPKTGTISYYDMPLVLGRYSNLEGDGFFDGYLDEVRIYDRALSNDEIIALYNNPAA